MEKSNLAYSCPEVAAPAMLEKDKENTNMYEKAGVKEYWIVEPEGKFVNVFTLQENNRYGRPETYTEENKVQVSDFPGLVIDLSVVFDNL